MRGYNFDPSGAFFLRGAKGAVNPITNASLVVLEIDDIVGCVSDSLGVIGSCRAVQHLTVVGYSCCRR